MQGGSLLESFRIGSRRCESSQENPLLYPPPPLPPPGLPLIPAEEFARPRKLWRVGAPPGPPYEPTCEHDVTMGEELPNTGRLRADHSPAAESH